MSAIYSGVFDLRKLDFSGGLDLKAQEAALRSGPDVVVATPGRLIDHLHNSPNFNLNTIEVGQYFFCGILVVDFGTG